MKPIPSRTAAPLVPEDLQRRKVDYFSRAAYAHAYAARRGTDPSSAVQALWGEDRATLALLERAATGPATSTTSGWASQLAQAATSEFISSLPQSAAAVLINAGKRVSLTGQNSIAFPGRVGVPAAIDSGWTAEGAPSPVVQFVIATAVLGPMRKVLLNVALTKECLDVGGLEVLSTMLRESAAATLDSGVFSSSTATAAKPAGLLAGVTPIAATAGAGESAMYADLEKLSAALSSSGGSGDYIYFAHPKQAVSAKLRLGADRAIKIYPTQALAAGTVVAVDPAAFVSAFSAEPTISASMDATVHLDDSSPAQIGVAGSPNVVAAPSRSAFQTDVIVVRCRLDACFVMRQPGLVAVVNSATWGG